MTAITLNNKNKVWIVGGVLAVAFAAFMYLVNPFNTTANQWIGPSKTAAPAAAVAK